MPKAKLGLTVQQKKKTPYDALGRRMEQGETEQKKVEKQGVRILNRAGVAREAAKTEARIPKATSGPNERRGRA